MACEPSDSLLGLYLGYVETGPPSPLRNDDSPWTARYKRSLTQIPQFSACCCEAFSGSLGFRFLDGKGSNACEDGTLRRCAWLLLAQRQMMPSKASSGVILVVIF